MSGIVTPTFRRDGAAAGMAASERIRQRLTDSGHRLHANDNIAAFLRPGELDELRSEVEARMQEVLRALVIDAASDHNSAETARGVAKMFVDEVFRGRYEDAPEITSFPNISQVHELICPIMGRVRVGIVPNEEPHLIGLSKYSRLCDWIMGRPQIQEEAIVMLPTRSSGGSDPTGWQW